MRWLLTLVLALWACKSPPPAALADATAEVAPAAVAPASAVHEVQWEAAGATVHGTLLVPVSETPVPAVLLIAGSGPTDRDWESPLLPGENGSGRLLAVSLAARGVAVLRYDKRGTGATAFPGSLTWDDYLQEQMGGLALLAAHPAIDASRLVVAGHSEGGAHALRLAAAPGAGLAGVALLCTAGRPLGEVVAGQIDAQLRGAGVDDDLREREVAGLRGALGSIAAGETVEPSAAVSIPGIAMLIAAFQEPSAVAFTRELIGWDPGRAFAAFDLPVLVVQGAKDLQVGVDDADRLVDAARAAGRAVRRVDLPDADHVLKHEPQPLEALDSSVALRYNAAGRTLAEGLVDALADFAHAPR